MLMSGIHIRMNSSEYDLNHILIPNCPLCELFLNPEKNINTHLYHPEMENVIYNDFAILDCEPQEIPFVTIRDHVEEISSELWGRILFRCNKIFGSNMRLKIDNNNIEDHWSAYVILPKKY